jgi:hypothetical protein
LAVTVANDEALNEARKQLEKAENQHNARVERYCKRYRAYRGVLEVQNDRWESQLHPPYALQIIEVLASNCIDEHSRARVLPTGPETVKGAKATEKLLAMQRRRDRFDEKNVPFVKQALIMGNSPGKVSWDYDYGPLTKRTFTPTIGGGYTMGEETVSVKRCDQPTFDPIPVEDFMWDPSASRFDQCAFVCYRSFATISHLRMMEAAGVYHSIDDLTETGGGKQDALTDTYIQRDRKNRVEIIEYWTRDRLIVMANRQVVIRDEPNPFWHGKLPFVLATPNVDLYSLEGLSDVDLVLDLQAAQWDLLNQTIDNTHLINNAIIMMRDTVDDPDEFKFAPGEKWLVSDPAEVMMWTPNHNVTTTALEMMQRLGQDIQDVTGAIPYLSGAGEGTVDQNTATGISVIQNMASRRIGLKRNMIGYAHCEIGIQQIALNQQFLSVPERIRIEHEDGYQFEVISPQDIQGQLDYEIENANESLNRQQARAEATQLFQAFVNPATFQVFQMAGKTYDPVPFGERLCDAYDIKNTSEIFGVMPPPMLMAGAPTPGSGGVPPGPGQPAPAPPIGQPGPPPPPHGVNFAGRQTAA